jgi:hypothetical protein
MVVTNDAGKYIGSEMWSRPIPTAESSSGLYLCSHLLQATGALEQPNKISGLIVVGGVQHSSSDNKWLLADREYGLEADLGQKLLQFAFWDNFLGCRGC